MLLEHFDLNRRELPWRGETDPYRILVSEVMLQQTRVETVLRYYGPWLERFPDSAALARASEDQVLMQWEGLGYYSRARRLQGAARVVRDRHGGVLPSRVESLLELPGIGAYTAAAVASIAFGVRAAAVDGNVRRVLARLFDLPRPSPGELRALASGLIDPERPGDWNQALMELGATVCTPRAPSCAVCPVSSHCRARGSGTVLRRPEPERRARPTRRRFALAVLARGDGRVLVVRRAKPGLLAGLWAFPESVVAEGDDPVDGALPLARGLGFDVLEGRPLPPVEHAFTHLRALYLPVLFQVGGRPRAPRGARWVRCSGHHQGVALPAAQRRILGAVAHSFGEGRFEEGPGPVTPFRPRRRSQPTDPGAA